MGLFDSVAAENWHRIKNVCVEPDGTTRIFRIWQRYTTGSTPSRFTLSPLSCFLSQPLLLLPPWKLLPTSQFHAPLRSRWGDSWCSVVHQRRTGVSPALAGADAPQALNWHWGFQSWFTACLQHPLAAEHWQYAHMIGLWGTFTPTYWMWWSHYNWTEQ